MNESQMKKTSLKAIDVIRQKDYKGFTAMFAPEIAKDIPEEEMNSLVDQIHDFLGRKEFPDAENIVCDTASYAVNGEILLVNSVIYKFDNPNHSLHSYSRALTFNFLEKYGTRKLGGVYLTDDKN